ncbi:MAG: hypothetical protein HQL45_06625 [Alphaproteobacteria bacterium]|nr:hypothetical protein [Alphaproteobacteria bacterium]
MRLLGVLVGWLALAAAWPALAGEKFDPKEVRVITPTTATSKCIGDPKTPICAVETFLACIERRDLQLCNIVGVNDIHLPDQPGSVRYRILKSRILADKDIPKRLKNVSWLKPGYADITILLPDVRHPWCAEGCQKDFSAKPTGAGWSIASWAMQGAD